MIKTRVKVAMAALAMAAMMDENEPNVSKIKRESKTRSVLSEEEKMRKKGMKEFKYWDGTIWALNQKSADRKAKKKGWI